MNTFLSMQDPGKKPNSRLPDKQELSAAAGKTVPDVIDYHLQVLFCGINPGLYTAWLGHHFGRPGNRFWPAMFASGFTPRLFDPREDAALLKYDLGITNLVSRATNKASELTLDELQVGKAVLLTKIHHYKPRFLAVLGVDSFRKAFALPNSRLGIQPDLIDDTQVWVLPNPSGLNAHFTPAMLKEIFQDLRIAVSMDG